MFVTRKNTRKRIDGFEFMANCQVRLHADRDSTFYPLVLKLKAVRKIVMIEKKAWLKIYVIVG